MRTAFLALVLLLAGCAQAPAADVSPTHPVATTGTLHGVVVDAAIRPLGGATVTLSTAAGLLRQNTTADGLWNFTGVAPGAHFLAASKTGYIPRQITVQAAAGSTANIKMQLDTDVQYRKPYIQSYEFKGLIECSVVAQAPPPVGYAAANVCNLPNEQAGQKVTDDQSITRQSVDGGVPMFVQCELVWESTQPLGDSFLLYMDEINNTGAGSGGKGSPTSAKFTELTTAHGTSPVVGRLVGREVDRLGRGFDLQVRVFAWSSDGTPAGATAEQSFTIYTNIFYGFAPPDGWMFIKDGLPAVPA